MSDSLLHKGPVYVLGINFVYHELSACLIKDGVLVVAVEEERFNRIKRGKKALLDNANVLPEQSIDFCLKKAGVGFSEMSFIGLSFSPQKRLENIGKDNYLEDGGWGTVEGEKLFVSQVMEAPALLDKMAGFPLGERVVWVPHHLSHASSAYFVSPFIDSAIMTIDGIGETASTWLGVGKNNNIRSIKEVCYPNSLGFVWEKISKFIGFTEYDSSKVMGLAAYGDPNRFYEQFKKIIYMKEQGDYFVDNEIFRFRKEDYSMLENHFKIKKNDSPATLSKDENDIAAALQKITTEIVIGLASYLKKESGSKNLSMAGGVSLNCVANEALLGSGLFDEIYIQPAANDAGTAMGAAFYIWNQKLNNNTKFFLDHAYWGPEYSDEQVVREFKNAEVNFEYCPEIEKVTAELLAKGNVIGWFQGKMEWGPRALGNRSLLADPRNSEMKEILNVRIKRRESFRPFAPSVLNEELGNWFNVHAECKTMSSDFMEINFEVVAEKRHLIPAVVHVDGTSRAQTVRAETNEKYYKLIKAFYDLTSVPMVLNTSFNENEPIVCSPKDAIATFLRTKMDYLVINNYLLTFPY